MNESEIQKHVELSKREIVYRLYLHTADETYVVARWCSWNGLSADFIWNALHALEKYLKCALLLNGKSVKKLSHDIEKAYAKLKSIAGNLLPDNLEQPNEFTTAWWQDETPEKFFERLMRYGGAGVRYNIAGYTHDRTDLYKLDEMVFHIRRLCSNLERVLDPTNPDRKLKHVLDQQPEFAESWPGTPLGKWQGTNFKSTDIARSAFNRNMRFAPAHFCHEDMADGASGSNSVLGTRMADLLRSANEDHQAIGVRVRDWFLKNNYATKELKKEICEIGPPFTEPPNRAAELLIAVLDKALQWLKNHYR